MLKRWRAWAFAVSGLVLSCLVSSALRRDHLLAGVMVGFSVAIRSYARPVAISSVRLPTRAHYEMLMPFRLIPFPKVGDRTCSWQQPLDAGPDRKSTRLNSSP